MSIPSTQPTNLPAWAEKLASPSRSLLAGLCDIQPPQNIGVEQARAQMRIGQDARLEDYPIQVHRMTLSDCDCILLAPDACSTPSAPVFFFHGGGWVMGDNQTHAYLIAELSLRTQLPLVSIGYPLAPETRFPANLERAYRAVRQILDAARRGSDFTLNGAPNTLATVAQYLLPERFALVGDSAGGNIAAAMTLLARRRGEPQPLLQALLYPALDAAMGTESHRTFAEGSNLTRKTMQWFWQQYLAENDALDPLASPLRAAAHELSGLAPALILTSECDILRDEGEAYAERLRGAGVSVNAVRYLGALHGFMATESLAHSTIGESAISFVAAELRRALLTP